MIYGKEGSEAGSSHPEVKLVDFAHVVEDEGIIDHNLLGGLCSLIKLVSDIVNSPGECVKRRFAGIREE
ncbi:hypothetical protein GIB67_012148 [Kingdonia uniflora]|nr:hypothetical protein GIB67_012148 [Kingdonia uniflora]